MTIGERIKETRKELGLTQTEFAEKIGVLGAAISLMEKNDRNPSETVVRAICREYSVNYEWLKTGKGVKLTPTDDFDVAALTNIMTGDDEFAKQLFRAFARLGAPEWRLLREFMEGVLRDTQANEQKK